MFAFELVYYSIKSAIWKYVHRKLTTEEGDNPCNISKKEIEYIEVVIIS
jgi:hypothetical protein